jgi:phenylalanyl-tRNA synthetase beta chain
MGVMGLVAEPLRREWRLADPVAVAELRLAPLLARVDAVPRVQAIPAFPGITRDVAMIVKEDVRHEEIVKMIRENAAPELTSVTLFDIFRDKEMGVGRKSLAYSLVYRSLERTLTDEDANRYHEVIKSALKSGLNAEIREG